MNPPTLEQAHQLISSILRYDLTEERLSALKRSGLLNDFLEAVKGGHLEQDVNPFRFRSELGLDEGVVRVVPGFKSRFCISMMESFETLADQSGLELSEIQHLASDGNGKFRDSDTPTVEKTYRLYSVNRQSIGGAWNELLIAGIVPANRFELMKFAYLNPMLPGYSKQVVALGSTCGLDNGSVKLETHPALHYNNTVKKIQFLENRDLAQNGGDIFPRTYFLGWHAESK